MRVRQARDPLPQLKKYVLEAGILSEQQVRCPAGLLGGWDRDVSASFIMMLLWRTAGAAPGAASGQE